MSMEVAIRSSNQPRSSGDWPHRLLRYHLPLALASAGVLLLFMTLPAFDVSAYPPGDIRSGTFPQEGASAAELHGTPPAVDGPVGQMDDGQMGGMGGHAILGLNMRQLTVATGYVATGLLGLTLLIGPANLLLRRRNPVSHYLRRDVGTWTAIFSVVHVIFGFQVHGTGELSGILSYFVRVRDGIPQLNSFGLGNWTGLAATVLVVVLLLLSTDGALRELKARTWKDLQRLNYTLFGLVILHGFFYGALLRMTSPYTLLGILIVLAVIVGQAVGVWLWRRRYSRAIVRVAGASR